MIYTSYKEAADAVYSGRQVVCHVVNHEARIDFGRKVMNSTQNGWTIDKTSGAMLRSGTGFLHIIIDAEETRGMEYHDSFGHVGGIIASRVRLK